MSAYTSNWLIILGLLTVLSPPIAMTQLPEPKFQRITMEHGLSQDVVSAIVQDAHGFMWFGTHSGLNRYDGYSMLTFKHDRRDSTSLPSEDIRTLYSDRRGRLWVGTQLGLCLYNPLEETFLRFTSREENTGESIVLDVLAISETPDSILLAATHAGLWVIFPDKRQLIRAPGKDSITHLRIGAMWIEQSGRVWISTSAGIYPYNFENNELIPEPRHEILRTVDGMNVTAMRKDAKGRFWVTTIGHGVFLFDSEFTSVKNYTHNPSDPRSIRDRALLTITEDMDGIIWIGSFQGLERFDEERESFEHIRENPNDRSSLLGTRVGSLFVDQTGALWVGTSRGGVNRLDKQRQKFNHIKIDPDTLRNTQSRDIFAIYETSAGDLLVGTDRGVYRRRYGSEKFEKYSPGRGNTSPLDRISVFSIYERRNGELWFGTKESRIFLLPKYSSDLIEFRFPLGSVRAIFEDRDNLLWVGVVESGLYIYDDTKKNFSRLKEGGIEEGVPVSGVWSIFQDSSGKLWFGTWMPVEFLLTYDKEKDLAGRFEVDKIDERALYSPSARGFHEDAEGAVWIATWGGGLHRYDPFLNAFSRIKDTDGLSNNFIKGMLTDGRGRMWMSTENGLTCFDPSENSFIRYGEQDGLQGYFFYSGSAHKGADGTMYFGGPNGLNIFHPERIEDNPHIPPVFITRFRVHNNIVPLTAQRQILSYGNNSFSFEFVALDYTDPGKNQYTYMLEGFDSEWIKAGTRRFAEYTKVKPGRYTFRVKGSNNDGVWNEEGAAVSIIIAPPYWQRWWFRLLILSAFGTVLFGVYRYRVVKLVEVERLRSRIAADLHDEVGSNLSTIALSSQLIARRNTLSEKDLSEIGEIGVIALQTSEMMKEIVWLLNPQNDSLDDLLLRMKALASQVLKNIDHSFDGPSEVLLTKVSLEKKRHLYLMYKEILHNILKHSAATRVRITVRYANGRLDLTVQDNGRGFVHGESAAGNGLHNLKSRSRQIGGTLDFVSAPGRGTSVNLKTEIT